MRLRGLVVLVPMAAACVGVANAQDTLHETAAIKLQGWSGELGLKGQHTESLQGSSDTRLSFLEERVGLRLYGFVYHPRLLSWDLGGELGLVQGWSDGFDGGDTLNSTLYRYHIDLEFLKGLAYGFGLHASRSDSVQLSLFGERTTQQSTQYSATGRYRGQFDLDVNASRNENVTRGSGTPRDEIRHRVIATGKRHGSSLGALDLRYEFDDFLDQRRGSKFRTHLGTLTHSIDSEGRVHHLDTRARVLDRQGDSEFRTTGITEAYSFRPLAELAIDATGGWHNDRVAGSDTRSTNVGGGLTHTLFGSLSSGVGANWNEVRPEVGRERRLRGHGQLSYRKQIPNGLLSLSYNGSWERTERDAPSQTRLVVDEAVLALDSNVVLLARENVDPTTVFVTDLGGATIYLEGLDYSLQGVGNTLRLIRLAGGSITNGQTVFVDYTYASGGDLHFDTQRHGMRSSLDLFDLLRPFYELNVVRQRRLDAGTGRLPDESTTQRWGLEFNWRWLHASYVGEDVRRDSGSYRGWTVEARLNLRPFESVALGLGGLERHISFGTDRTETTRVYLQSRWQASGSLSVKLQGSWQQERGRAESELLLADASLHWVFQGLEATLRGRYQRSDRGDSPRDDLFASFDIVRRF